MYTLAVVGDAACGKSSLLLRYTTGKFEDIVNTNGIDTRTKDVDVEGSRVQVSIRDTGGQERYRTMTTTHYRNVQGVILVFDLTDKQTYESIVTGWLKEAENYANSETVKILVGNKSDLVEKRAISTEECQEFAEGQSMEYFECSAKTGANVEEAIQSIVTELYKRGPIEPWQV